MSNGEVKRYYPHTYHGGDVVSPSMEENEYGAWVKHDDHKRLVAELKASIEHSETKVGWLLHDNEKNVRERDAVIAKQAKVIEKLKEQRNAMMPMGDMRNYCDKELEAIERVEA